MNNGLTPPSPPSTSVPNTGATDNFENLTPPPSDAAAVAKTTAQPADFFQQLAREGLAAGHRPNFICAALLRELHRDRPEDEFATILPNEGLRRAWLLKTLRHEPEATRLDFAAAMLQVAVETPKSNSIRSILPKIFQNLPPNEKLAVSQKALPLLESTDESTRAAAGATLVLIFTTAKTFGELRYLVDRLGRERLLAANVNELSEAVAAVALGTKMRRRPLPRMLSKNANTLIANRKLKEIDTDFRERLEICTADPRLNRTQVGRQYVQKFKENLSVLRHERKHLSGSKARRDLANMLITKAGVEIRYGLVLVSDRRREPETKRETGIAAGWTRPHVLDIDAACARFPTGLILLTRKLGRIRMMAKDMPALFGCRLQNGLIELYRKQIENGSELSSLYKGMRPMKIVASHEILHGLHHARYRESIEPKSIRDVMQGCDPRWDTGYFLQLSDWQVHRMPFTLLNKAQRIRFDEDGRTKHIRLDTSVLYHGEERVFRYSKPAVAAPGTLYSHLPFAQFAMDENNRSRPEEDFVDGVTEYLWDRERLLQDAPLKTLHHELQLGLYDKDKDWLARIEARVKETLLDPENQRLFAAPRARITSPVPQMVTT